MKHHITAAVVAAAVAFGIGYLPKPTNQHPVVPQEVPVSAPKKETAFERIMRTGEIRCGYWVSPPMIIRDPNTGAMSGAFVEYVEELGKALSLKINWAQEINFSTYLQDINTGKIDAECATGWPNALRGKQVEYTAPIGYMPMYVYVADGDRRFDNNLEGLNDPSVKFSGQDGGTNALAREKYFPKSELISLPGDSSQAEPLNMVKFGKATATLATGFEGINFMKENPDTIRRVVGDPVRIIPMTMSIGANEQRLVNMLNTATNELLYDGTIEKIYMKYDVGPDAILRVAKPYEDVK